MRKLGNFHNNADWQLSGWKERSTTETIKGRKQQPHLLALWLICATELMESRTDRSLQRSRRWVFE